MDIKKKYEFADKRQCPRYAAHYLADIVKGKEVVFATVIDVSESGVAIILKERMDVDTKFNVKVRCWLENEEETDIEFKARVVWVGKCNEKGISAGGLEILEISEENLRALKKHIQIICEQEKE